ncbi:Signal transduction histidine kinase [Halorientalis persicus]|uniref:histidine kinase n=1 Tax=Halorientalis persicus TaxID=1367881 RepID=A0A1H8JRN5_9EURY|nr:sensor histidine kinase [Halorientalis persicus]SEN83372.1 Signal transduction histidine kinase [Halorientalis persicus]
MVAVGWTLGAVAVGCACVATVVRTNRHRDRPGAIPFALLVSLLSGLAVAVSLWQAGLAPVGSAVTVEALLLGGYAFTSVLWIGFVFEYTGRGPVLTAGRWAGLIALGCLAIGSTAVTWLHEIGRVPLGTVGRVSYLTTFILQIAVFSLGLLGIVLIVRSAIAYDDLSLPRASVLTVAGLGITFLPLTVGFSRLFTPGATLRTAFLQLCLVVGLFAAMELGDGLFETGPTAGHLARETVLDTVASPVAVVDRENRLLDLNEAAAEVFAIDRTRLRERSLDAVAGVDEETDLSAPLTIRTADGRREFVVDRSAIGDGTGSVLGYAYRFRDVTDRKTREQRLQVLNRITRHNLRNDLDAIRGFAETIREEELGDAETEEYFDRIETLAHGLVDLSSAIERSERLLTDPTPNQKQCDLTAVAETVADRTDGERITVDSPADPVEIRSDPEIVRLVLEELVENSMEHIDGDEPVVVAVRQSEAGGTLDVRDSGPGIPEHEQAVLLEGEETAGMHGTGVGLWLVAWGVTRLGGRLSFGDRASDDSTVTVHLPDLGAEHEPE